MSEAVRDAHAFVTGGGRGIGAAIAAALARAGAVVTIAARDESALEAHAGTIRSAGGRVETVRLDVADEASVDAAFGQAVSRSGEVGILVNNAGIAAGGLVTETSLDTWNRTLAVNLTGAFLCSRRVLPAMVDAGRGRIINVASTAGLRGVQRIAAYSSSKHGLIGLTRSLALEVAKRGITVNAVCPGYTESDMAEQAVTAVMDFAGATRDEAVARISRVSPLGRILGADEVAATVVWLCSDEAASITGQSIVLGGEVQ